MIGIKNTSTDTFRKILGNGLTYKVPKFQRDYSWEAEQWDDLWQDLILLHENETPAHYMGYLVLQTSNDKDYKIIDGQQRITTMSLLILSILKSLQALEERNIDAINNSKRREQLRGSYIGVLNPVTLIPNNKLKLNRNNNDFYTTYLVPLLDPPRRGLKSSEHLMRKCSDWFYQKLNQKFKTGETLTAFIDDVVDKLFFTVITVGDELNAYTVFETLNARGVQLSSADLLKNYLFSIVDDGVAHSNEFETLENLWGKLIGKLGSNKLPDFLRYYWNSKYRTTRKKDLFKTIKSNIEKYHRVNRKQQVFELLRDLVQKVDLYIALKTPTDEFWNNDIEIRESLKELQIFGAKQPISLLISAYDKLDLSGFKIILKICSTIYFRYNIISSLNPNEQERVFNKIANQIYNESKYDKKEFEKIYPKDEEFKVNFANISFKRTAINNKIVKYILGKIENRFSGTAIDFGSDQNSIEHILPENAGDEWNIEDEALNRSKFRLGNLTLLEKSVNNQLKTSDFDTKKVAFSKSNFLMTQQIAKDYAEWNEGTIDKRQRNLAKSATAIWKIQF